MALAHLPTPLHRLDNLSHRFEPLNLFVKRDDQTGLAFGGNKARKLDYIMAEAMRQGADSIVTWGGVQSNWCRQVAAAAAKLGLRAVLILFKGPKSPEGDDGNLLLDRMFEAEIRVVDATGIENMLELESVRHVVEPVAAELKSNGLTPYIAPIGGSLVEGSMQGPWGALGYLEAFIEIKEQADQLGVQIDSVVLATGSAGTQAGLLVGANLLSPHTKVIGITVYGDSTTVSRYVRSIAEQAIEHLGVVLQVKDEDIIVFDEYLGEGYGVFNSSVGDAIALFARSEGLLLDPVYTGKSAAGMLDLMGRGYFSPGENILFMHTGGTPVLFPYRAEIIDFSAADRHGRG
jgi:L-cysteate sulfo-lyase